MGLLKFLVNSALSLNKFVSLQYVYICKHYIKLLKYKVMARLYGLNGLIRGRQGNNVFSVQNGTQVLKQYNPAVANPKTLPQQQQRVKFALAGKMSGATPILAIQGMVGSNNRSRRARFVSLIARQATVSGSVNNLTASVNYQNIIYSEGAVPRWSANPTVTAEYSGTEANSNVVVTLTALHLNENAPSGYGEVAVVALYDARTSMLDEVQAFERSRSSSLTVTFRQGARRDCFVVVYVNPYILESGVGGMVAGNLEGSSTAVSLNGVSATPLANAYWGVTNFVRSIPVLGTNSLVSHSPDDDTRVVEGEKKK